MNKSNLSRTLPIDGKITHMRTDWIEKHVDYKGFDCLPWPYDIDTSARAFFAGQAAPVSPIRYMCEKVHGPAPAGRRFAVADCLGKFSGCLNPTHLQWMNGTERHNSMKYWKAEAGLD